MQHGVFGNGGSNGVTVILSRDRKWPHLTKYTHLRVVCFRLQGHLVLIFVLVHENVISLLSAISFEVINAILRLGFINGSLK